MVLKTSFEILNLIFPILNVANVTSLISGEVYRTRRPVNSDSQDITIQVLSIVETNDVVQEAIVNINIFIKNIRSDDYAGLPDETKLKTVADAVIIELDGYSDTSTYFNFDIIWMNSLPDEDNKKDSYYNIRLNCRIENNK